MRTRRTSRCCARRRARRARSSSTTRMSHAGKISSRTSRSSPATPSLFPDITIVTPMSRFLLALLAALAVAVPVRAQDASPRPQPIGGLFGGRRAPDTNHPDPAKQELTFESDVFTGYDRQQGTQLISNEFTQAGV